MMPGRESNSHSGGNLREKKRAERNPGPQEEEATFGVFF